MESNLVIKRFVTPEGGMRVVCEKCGNTICYYPLFFAAHYREYVRDDMVMKDEKRNLAENICPSCFKR